MEIERKFLVDISRVSLPSEYSSIEQGYISFDPEVRIRKKGNKFYKTIKGDGTIARTEEETTISETEYMTLLNSVSGRVIKKTRYRIPLGGDLTAELDIYQEDFEGLATVEVEFKDMDQATNFVPPEWFELEVTEDKRYKNKNLARCGDLGKLIPNNPQKAIGVRPNL